MQKTFHVKFYNKNIFFNESETNPRCIARFRYNKLIAIAICQVYIQRNNNRFLSQFSL